MRRRFSIRDLLWLTVVAGLAIGWWLDHREQVNRFEAMNGPLSIQVYSITVADPNAVLKVLQTMLAGTQVRLMVDTKSNFMVAYATPSQHAMIRTLVDKLEGKRNRQHQVRRQIRCRTSRNMKSLVPIIRSANPRRIESSKCQSCRRVESFARRFRRYRALVAPEKSR